MTTTNRRMVPLAVEFFLVHAGVWGVVLYYGADIREVSHDVLPAACGLGFLTSTLFTVLVWILFTVREVHDR